jgi:hypothetical protein
MKNLFKNVEVLLLLTLLGTNVACSANSTRAETINSATCTVQDAQAAERSVDGIQNWQQLFDVFKLYHHCDQASIAEGFDDVVVHLLIRNWDSISVVSKLGKDSPGFTVFVLRHLTELASPEDLKVIQQNATSACRAGDHTICHEITRKIAGMKK